MFKKLQEKAGYVSIETVIIAGLMLTLGVIVIKNLFTAGEDLATDAIAKVDAVTVDNPVQP